MSDNKRILKNSGILYVRLLITSIVGLISTRLLLQALGVSDYGLYSIVGGIVIMMGFLNTVMISTTYRYIAFEMGKGNFAGINQVFNISLIIHICIALILILFAETLGVFYINNYLNVPKGNISDALFVFRFSVWGTFFSILSVPYQGLITAQENFFIRASIEIIRSILKLGAVFLIIYYLGNRLRLYSVLIMIVMLVPPVLFYLYSLKKYASIIQWNFQKKWEKYNEMVSFSGWIMIGAGASVGKTQGAALIINSFFGTVLNASFGIANQVSTVVTMFAQNLGQAAIPQITKSFSAGNTNRSTELTIYISKYSFLLMLFPALPILLETDFILKLWLNDVPEYSGIFIKLMIVYALIESMSTGIYAVVQASGKIKWFQIISSTILLLCLPIAYFLFTLGLQPYYIVVVYISSLILILLVNLILLKKIVAFDVKALISKSYLKSFTVVLFIIPLFFIRNFMTEGLFRLVTMTLLGTITYLNVVFFFGLERHERQIIISTIKKAALRRF